MHYADRPQEAVALTRRAMRLCPIYPAGYLIALGRSCHYAGLYEEALEAYELLLEHNKKGELDPLWTHLGFTATYLELGQSDKAIDHFAEVLKADTNFQFFGWARAHLCYRDLEYLRRLIDPLRPATGTAAKKRKLFVHTGVPKFKLKYPQGSKKLSSTSPYVPLRMRTLSKEGFNVIVADIPNGRDLSEIGSKVFLSRFIDLGIGSNFEVISNEAITLKDGTQAYKTEINWLYGDGNSWLTSLLVSAFKDDKRVSVIVHTYGDPAEVAWIAESLKFE
jgi:tetratricopeptide (TPR) repeat protein